MMHHLNLDGLIPQTKHSISLGGTNKTMRVCYDVFCIIYMIVSYEN
jgi:hypothetical protein